MSERVEFLSFRDAGSRIKNSDQLMHQASVLQLQETRLQVSHSGQCSPTRGRCPNGSEGYYPAQLLLVDMVLSDRGSITPSASSYPSRSALHCNTAHFNIPSGARLNLPSHVTHDMLHAIHWLYSLFSDAAAMMATPYSLVWLETTPQKVLHRP